MLITKEKKPKHTNQCMACGSGFQDNEMDGTWYASDRSQVALSVKIVAAMKTIEINIAFCF